MSNPQFSELNDLLVQKRLHLGEPPRYKVLIHNDHYTTMEFVVEILEEVFHHSRPAAENIMLQVHRRGLGCCGEFDRQIAESKVDTVSRRAAEAGFPLRCTMEKI